MTREERYKFLQLFGDKKPHDWFNIVFLGVNFLKTDQKHFEDIFRKAVEIGLIDRVDNPHTLKVKKEKDYVLTKQHYNYQLTERGDECLRIEKVAREGNDYYYQNFDRSIEGKHGLDQFAPLPKGLTKLD